MFVELWKLLRSGAIRRHQFISSNKPYKKEQLPLLKSDSCPLYHRFTKQYNNPYPFTPQAMSGGVRNFTIWISSM